MQQHVLNNSGKQRVMIFPAKTPKIAGKQIYFLFTLPQVEDIVRDIKVYPVPFVPSYIAGIAQWRTHVVPVISLEQCVGLTIYSTSKLSRMVMIRTEDSKIKGMVIADPAIHILPLPDSVPLVSVPWRLRQNLIRGIYEWSEGFLLVVYMKKILHGSLKA